MGEYCEGSPLGWGSDTSGARSLGGGAERVAWITCFKVISAAPLELCGRCINVVRNAHTEFWYNIVKFLKEIFPAWVWTSWWLDRNALRMIAASGSVVYLPRHKNCHV